MVEIDLRKEKNSGVEGGIAEDAAKGVPVWIPFLEGQWEAFLKLPKSGKITFKYEIEDISMNVSDDVTGSIKIRLLKIVDVVPDEPEEEEEDTSSASAREKLLDALLKEVKDDSGE